MEIKTTITTPIIKATLETPLVVVQFPGTQGVPGPEGVSAYDVAVDNGFVGTESDRLLSLQGNDGDDGLSAYQVAVANGFVGTAQERLDSLEGEPGEPTDVSGLEEKICRNFYYSIKSQIVGNAEEFIIFDNTSLENGTFMTVSDNVNFTAIKAGTYYFTVSLNIYFDSGVSTGQKMFVYMKKNGTQETSQQFVYMQRADISTNMLVLKFLPVTLAVNDIISFHWIGEVENNYYTREDASEYDNLCASLHIEAFY